MAEIKPLPIYPSTPTGADLTLLKEAKERLDTPFLVSPVKAVPGSPGRVIALRQRPDFLCDYAYIPDPNPTSVLEALKWALGTHDDPRGVTVVHMLKEIFGDGTFEL